MGASGMGGGGKSANVELNLVPFIDLLSTLICFLLITAVWQELDSISSNAPPKATADAPSEPVVVPKDKQVTLIVSLSADKTEFSEDNNVTTFPYVNGEPDSQKIIAKLREWKAKFPTRSDLIFATDNSSKYKFLVAMMDYFQAEKFSDVGINLN